MPAECVASLLPDSPVGSVLHTSAGLENAVALLGAGGLGLSLALIHGEKWRAVVLISLRPSAPAASSRGASWNARPTHPQSLPSRPLSVRGPAEASGAGALRHGPGGWPVPHRISPGRGSGGARGNTSKCHLAGRASLRGCDGSGGQGERLRAWVTRCAPGLLTLTFCSRSLTLHPTHRPHSPAPAHLLPRRRACATASPSVPSWQP